MTYCIECGCETPFTIKRVPCRFEVRGYRCEYQELQAICDYCLTEMDIPALHDANCDLREWAFEKARRGL